MVTKSYKRTEEMLQKYEEKLKLLVEELLKHEVLNYDNIEALIGPPPYGKKKTLPETLVNPIKNGKIEPNMTELGDDNDEDDTK